jgi:hypothetical protein
MIGILGSDVLFRSKHGYCLTRGGWDYRILFAEKVPHNPLARWDRKEETGDIASSLCAVVSSGNQ